MLGQFQTLTAGICLATLCSCGVEQTAKDQDALFARDIGRCDEIVRRSDLVTREKEAIERELGQADSLARSPVLAAQALRRATHRTGILERELERVDDEFRRCLGRTARMTQSLLIEAEFDQAYSYHLRIEAIANQLLAATEGEEHALVARTVGSLDFDLEYRESCTTAPVPVVKRIYATGTVIKLSIKSGCERVDEWGLYREIEPSPGQFFNIIEIARGTSLSSVVRDTGLNYGTEYCYFAIAANEFGSAISERFCTRTGVRPAQPAAPSELEVVRMPVSSPNREQVQLLWRDNSDNEHGFVIMRAKGSEYNTVFDANEREYAFAYYVESSLPSEMEHEIFTDTDALESDTLYCYYLYAHNPWGESAADHACVWTNPKRPEQPVLDQWEIEEDRIRVRIRSIYADWYQVIVRSGGQVVSNEVHEPGSSVHFNVEMEDLQPSTEYCFEVKPVNHPREISSAETPVWGPVANECHTTTGLPEVQTMTIWLQRQTIESGPIPYIASWPSTGILNARLLEISVPDSGLSGAYVIHFVKPGYSTQDCNNPSAVVSIPDGTSTTQSQVDEIFGSATPHTPLLFVACVSGPTVLDSRPINLLYQPD